MPYNGEYTKRSVTEIGMPFSLTHSQKATVELSDTPIGAASLTFRMNEAADLKKVLCLHAAELEDKLLSHGILALGERDGRPVRLPTERGKALGVSLGERKIRQTSTDYFCLYSYGAQRYIVSHINELLDHGTDEEMPQTDCSTVSAAAGMQRSGSDTAVRARNFNFCWNCENRIVTRFTFKCSECGWPICPKCGACRAPRCGGCPETGKGNRRYTGLMAEKNGIRALLANHGMLNTGNFSELSAVSDSEQLRRFKQNHAAEFSQIEDLRQAKEEEKKDEKKEKLHEIALNQKGIYRIVTETPRLITYITAHGMKYTVPNRSPVRTKNGYVLLSEKKPGDT